jgi:hypothetical protein
MLSMAMSLHPEKVTFKKNTTIMARVTKNPSLFVRIKKITSLALTAY